jgi:hypothetical protein
LADWFDTGVDILTHSELCKYGDEIVLEGISGILDGYDDEDVCGEHGMPERNEPLHSM